MTSVLLRCPSLLRQIIHAPIRSRPPSVAARIMQSRASGGGPADASSANPRTSKIQKLLASDPLGGWEDCWKEGITPWDIGKPTPVILHLLETGSLPKGRVFIPGCGTGYDVAAIAGPERFVVGLDISEVAVKKAMDLFATSENLEYFTFVAADFFTWHPSELFDLIIDYTFFCAIEPHLRSAWAAHVQKILKPEGELLTLIFPIGDYDGGPPYALSVSAYEDVLHPLGFKAISVVDNELAIGPRKGREKLARWKRTAALSTM